MHLKFIYKPYLVHVPEIQNRLIIILLDWSQSCKDISSCWYHIYILSQPWQGILTFLIKKLLFLIYLSSVFFLNCAFKDLHSKRGEMEKKQAAVSIRIVNLWECGATKLMKGDCSSCHYSVLFDDCYSTIYASLTVVSWYQKFEKKLLNNWEKKLFCFSSDSIILLSIFWFLNRFWSLLCLLIAC